MLTLPIDCKSRCKLSKFKKEQIYFLLVYWFVSVLGQLLFVKRLIFYARNANSDSIST